MIFKDRADAGRRLAAELGRYAGRPGLVVLALPRGGVAVGRAIADALAAPLDVFVIRKLGVPGHEELAMGAIAGGDVLVLNPQVVQSLDISQKSLRAVVDREREELARREAAYRDERGPPEIRGRTVILVDDGLATGASMQAAIKAVAKQGPAQLVVAVPVAARSAAEQLAQEVDSLVCTAMPEPFYGVGQWYDDFRQMTDEDVRELLELTKPVP